VTFTGHIPDEIDPVAVCIAQTECFDEHGAILRSAQVFTPESVGPVVPGAKVEFVWSSYGPRNLLSGFTIETFSPPSQEGPFGNDRKIEHEFVFGKENVSLFTTPIHNASGWTIRGTFRILQGGGLFPRLFVFHGPTMTGGDTGNGDGGDSGV